MDCETKLNPGFYYIDEEGNGSNICERLVYPPKELDMAIACLQTRKCLSNIYDKLKAPNPRFVISSLDKVLWFHRDRQVLPEHFRTFFCDLPFAACLLVAYTPAKDLEKGVDKFAGLVTDTLKEYLENTSTENVDNQIESVYNSLRRRLDSAAKRVAESVKRELEVAYAKCRYHAAFSLVDAK